MSEVPLHPTPLGLLRALSHGRESAQQRERVNEERGRERGRESARERERERARHREMCSTSGRGETPRVRMGRGG